MVRATEGLATGWSWVRILVAHLRNFSNSVYPTLPVSFGGDIKRLDLMLMYQIKGSIIQYTKMEKCHEASAHIFRYQEYQKARTAVSELLIIAHKCSVHVFVKILYQTQRNHIIIQPMDHE